MLLGFDLWWVAPTPHSPPELITVQSTSCRISPYPHGEWSGNASTQDPLEKALAPNVPVSLQAVSRMNGGVVPSYTFVLFQSEGVDLASTTAHCLCDLEELIQIAPEVPELLRKGPLLTCIDELVSVPLRDL